MRNLGKWLVGAAGLFLALEPASSRADDGPLGIEVASGRQFAGQIDGESTDQQLVIRTMTEGITLRRPIAWSRIVGATFNGQPISIKALRELAGQTAQQDQRAASSDRQNRTIELRGASQTTQPRPTQAPIDAPRVASISLYAYIANWDADVETDGLVLELAPVDINGNIAAVSGMLEVELFGFQRRTLDQASRAGGATLELVERWTRQLQAEDIGPSGTRLRLPFGAIHPEIDPNWAASWYGLVHVKLSIPGQGVFEDSRDGVRIRPWAPTRDRLQMKTGQRFLPTEGVGRHD